MKQFLSWVHEPIELTSDQCRRAHIGPTYWKVSVSAIPDAYPYKECLVRYLNSMPDSIYNGIGIRFVGPHRTGKTSAAILIAKFVLCHGGTALFVEAKDIQRQVIDSHMFDDEMTMDRRMRDVDLLVLDDLGSEYGSKHAVSCIESVLRERHNERQSTVITTNVSEADLTDAYGEGIICMLDERSPVVMIEPNDWHAQNVANANRIVYGEE